MRRISGNRVGSETVSDAYGAADQAESEDFMRDLLALCEKHRLALVPQSDEYEVSFHERMRVVPLTKDIKQEIAESWVAFEVRNGREGRRKWAHTQQ